MVRLRADSLSGVTAQRTWTGWPMMRA
jgi:hypothetical protein